MPGRRKTGTRRINGIGQQSKTIEFCVRGWRPRARFGAAFVRKPRQLYLRGIDVLDQPEGSNVGTQPSHRTRLRPDQRAEIDKVRQIRGTAADLRSRVSEGSYGDEELEQFWLLAETAGDILSASNPEVAERAGLGDNFFLSVARDRRRPKLANFLKALTAVIEVADERLFDVHSADNVTRIELPPVNTENSLRIEKDCAQLLSLTTSLEQMARNEIEKIDSERPNDPETLESNRRQRELLQIFADGFSQIVVALSALSGNPNQPLLMDKARDVVNSVGDRISAWWRKNGADAIDWSVRIPVIAAGVAMLGWAGANMTVGTCSDRWWSKSN
jgi:hypothetical protein